MKRIRTAFTKITCACAAVCMTAAFSVSALAASAQDIQAQMATNSAAWEIASAAGDTAACDRLHAANAALAEQLAGTGGSASYNAADGTWDITGASGGRTRSSAGGSLGKDSGVTFTTATESGGISQSSSRAYMDDSIQAYLDAGGTDSGLRNAYNSAAQSVAEDDRYERGPGNGTAAQEISVAKQLLGLTDRQADTLLRSITSAQNAYNSAKDDYESAVRAGDTEAAAEARSRMDRAHETAENIRAQYSYTGDTDSLSDGGSYFGGTARPVSADRPGSAGDDGPEDRYFTITASGTGGGTVSPSGSVSVKEGADRTFTIVPDEGWRVSELLVDGTETAPAERYTFRSVTGSHTFTAVFEQMSAEITAAAGNGGSISPSGTVRVSYGGSASFTVTPDEGYAVAGVLVDGTGAGAVPQYTFRNVTEAHTISASFRASGSVSLGGISVTDSLGTDLSGGSIKSGYGIFVNVPVSAEGVNGVHVTVSYDFGSGTRTVTLVRDGGSYVFPKNSASPAGARCVYIPAETKDAVYALTVTVTAENYDGETVSDTAQARITVRGSMYEDDFTGDS